MIFFLYFFYCIFIQLIINRIYNYTLLIRYLEMGQNSIEEGAVSIETPLTTN
jgi:hypothetical protein